MQKEIIIENIDTNIPYSKDDEQAIVGKVSKTFDAWQDDMQENISLWGKLDDMLNITESKVRYTLNFDNLDGDRRKKEVKEIKDADILQLFNTAVAHTYNANFKTPSQMFSVSMKYEVPEINTLTNANKQKSALLDVWDKAKGKDAAREAINYYYKTGECIFYIKWKQIYQNIRRKGENGWEVSKVLKYDGSDIKCLNPVNVVFDTSNDDAETRACIKREYLDYNKIKNNKTYSKFLKKEDLETLKNMLSCENEKDLSDLDLGLDKADESRAIKDNKAEILEYVGDFEINDKYYSNMKIIVIGRMFVGFYGYNPQVINPFVICIPRIYKDTGRGLPALSFIIPMVEATQELINKINDAIGLSINKCYLAPKGSLTGNMALSEGGVIEYDPELMPTPPAPINVAEGIPVSIQYLQFIEGKKEQAFGHYKNSSGDTTLMPKTATESKIIMAGQNVLDAYENDIIGEMIVEIFEKLGEMQANFSDNEQYIIARDNSGKEYSVVIDNEVRQAAYSYTLGDSASNVEKKANAEQTLAMLEKISQLANTQGKQLSLGNTLNLVGSINDIENPDTLIEDIPQPPPPQPPSESIVKDMLARYAIQKLQLPDELKAYLIQELEGGGIEQSGEAGMPIDVQALPNAGMAIPEQILPEQNL